MSSERISIYDDLERDLRGFPVGDYVRAYARAYLEADLETIRKLQELLLGDISERSEPGAPPDMPPDAPIGAPNKPRPHLNSGAVAVPEPDDTDSVEGDAGPGQAFPPSSRPTIPSKIRVAQSAQTD
jgi:hypothetical protein